MVEPMNDEIAGDERPGSPEFRVLVSFHWKGDHFHAICAGNRGDSSSTVWIKRHLLPEEFSEGPHQFDLDLNREDLTEVEGREYGYICTILLDLDKLARGESPFRPKPSPGPDTADRTR